MSRPMDGAPYYDDYDGSKDYTTVLAVPGYAEQAREFTQIQTTLYDYLGRLGDSVLSNGSIVEGCVLVVQGTQAIISSGKLYFDGLVRRVDGSIVEIEGVGSEVIGVKIERSVVTELEDPTLRDPAQGYENYNQPGAHRIKERVVFARNDPESTSIYRLEDGLLAKTEEVPELAKIIEILARRTFDESGNYKIAGLELRDRQEVRDNQVVIDLTEGKAYVEGFEVVKPFATTIALNNSSSTRTITNEPKGYSGTEFRYWLNNQPVKQINLMKAVVELSEPVTRGNLAGGIDYLAKSPVLDIMSVVQGATTYQKGVDFQLVNDGVDWSLNGVEPTLGSTYTVVYRYNKTMVSGVDYQLSFVVEDNKHCVEFLSGDKPVNGSSFDLTYDFYLSREDLIALDRQGNPVVLEGVPDILRLVKPPVNQDRSKLVIGTVLVYSNSSRVKISNRNTTRLSMNDLFKLTRRVDDIEYNQAISDLDEEAMAGESATDLKGIFTDGFIGFTKIDPNHPDVDCTIDLDSEELSLPAVVSVSKLNPNLSSTETTVGQLGRVLMAPYTHELAFTQNYASDTMLVNPYAVYAPMSLVKLEPSFDNWIDTETIQVESETTRDVTIRRWWGSHLNDPWSNEVKKQWTDMGFADGGLAASKSNYTAPGKGTLLERTSEAILDEAIFYMRSIPIKVVGQNFLPGDDNIKCYFNEIEIPLTPINGSVQGTKSGTVKADSTGRFNAQFTVPSKVPTGTVEVRLQSSNSQGSTVYRAQGRKLVIQETVLTVIVTVKPYDPLAQSFIFEQDTILTKVGLYFAAKDPNKAVQVEVRNMVNGYPGTTIYATTIVDAASVNISPTGTAVTDVVFDQPVYCNKDESYCVAILSDSNMYSMFVTALGEKDLNSNNYITSQAYTAGVLFSSSNALTWTAHQTMDLRFDLYRAKYTGEGVVVFNDVEGVDITRVVLAAQYIDYQNAGIEWSFKANNGPWLPIDTYSERELNQGANKVSLRVKLKVSNTTSPILAKDTMNLIGFIEKTQGTYVSRNIVMDEEFTKIRVLMDLALPSGTTCKVYYQTIDTSEDWVQLIDPVITPVSMEFSKYEWNTELIESGATNYRVKVVLDTVNPLVKPRGKKLMSILKY